MAHGCLKNVWGWLSREVYEESKQYEDVASLINAIETAWDKISLDYDCILLKFTTLNTEWHTVVFSDEKKINLDGPDGYNFYYHDIRKKEVILSRLHSRIGGVMLWSAIPWYGQIKLEFKTTKLNAEQYKNISEWAIPEWSNIFGPLRWIFQQDNAPIHNARAVKASIVTKMCRWCAGHPTHQT